MQIREYADVVRLIRVVRPAGAMRSKQIIVATFRVDSGPSQATLEILDADERAGLRRWMSIHERLTPQDPPSINGL